MVYLNKSILFDISLLKKYLTLELEEFIEDELYAYLHKEKIKNKIKNKIYELFNYDSFVYKTMDENICIFKHMRGKKEGHFCTRKINTNLIDGKKDYLCTIHSKKHVPKKKLNKKPVRVVNDISIMKLKNEKKNFAKKMDTSNFENKNNKRDHCFSLKNKNGNNKIYVGNSGLFIISDIIKCYNIINNNHYIGQQIINIPKIAFENKIR